MTGPATVQEAGPSAARNLHALARRGALALIGFVFVLTALALFADVRQLGAALRTFDWWLIVPILLLACWNDGWRFLKWQFFLRETGVHGLPWRRSLRIFLAGFAMVVTPGKVGEFVKAIYVRRDTGTPVNRTMAVVVAERATDALALLVLAAIGAVRYSYGRAFLLVMIAGGIVGVALLQRPELLARMLRFATGHRRLERFRDEIGAFFAAAGHLFGTSRLLIALAMSLVSWAAECLALWLILVGLGIEPSWSLLLAATSTLAVSSIAGGVSMLPGGLGVADASVTGMLLLLVHDDAMTRGVAVAATLLIRFATLWFAVLVGVVALVSLEREGRRATANGAGVRGEA